VLRFLPAAGSAGEAEAELAAEAEWPGPAAEWAGRGRAEWVERDPVAWAVWLDEHPP
jgi:hypothetical protein